MKLLESKDILEELLKESEELLKANVDNTDFKYYQQLHLGLLTVQCRALKEALIRIGD